MMMPLRPTSISSVASLRKSFTAESKSTPDCSVAATDIKRPCFLLTSKTFGSLPNRRVFHKGTAAVYDTFSGLVPCRVVSIHKPAYGFRIGSG